jgi:alpha-glucoside transport system permease protein
MQYTAEEEAREPVGPRADATGPVGGPGASKTKTSGPLEWLVTNLVRVLVAVAVPLLTFIGLYAGFIFLRDSQAPKGIVAVVAIVWGVGGVALLYFVSNSIIERLGDAWRSRLQPFVFVGPAVAILIWYLAFPTLRTFWISLWGPDGAPGSLSQLQAYLNGSTTLKFVGLNNYVAVFTDRNMFTAFRNNIMWIVFGATLCVVFGLLVAVLADRSRFETFAKSLIFLPMAISMVGAGVIFNLIYAVNPNIGMLNAIYTSLTGNPSVAWTASAQLQPWNNLFLIAVMIWLQTGYCMVLFSAALKGISTEILEAARVDGANEIQVFFQIMVPSIMGTIITVATTVIIFTLKIFDVVWVMTGGQFSTQVIATTFYREYFTNQNSGYGSAIAIVLLIAVVPVMIYNLKQFRESEAFA